MALWWTSFMLNVIIKPFTLSVIMLIDIMLSFILLNVILVSVIMLNVIMLNVIIQSVTMLNAIIQSGTMLNVIIQRGTMLNVIMLSAINSLFLVPLSLALNCKTSPKKLASEEHTRLILKRNRRLPNLRSCKILSICNNLFLPYRFAVTKKNVWDKYCN